MKHSKLIGSLLAVGIIGSAATLSAYGFRRLRDASKTFEIAGAHIDRTASVKHSVPVRTSASVVRRVSESETPTLRGLVVNGSIPYICEFKGEEGLRISNIFDDDLPEASGSAFYAEGKFYAMSLEQPYVGEYETTMTVYDAETWDVLEVREGLSPTSTAHCICYDPMTGAAYGYFTNDDIDTTWQMFGRMNLATGEVLGLNNVDSDEGFLAIACATDGYLYGINATGMFCRITKRGEVTKLGHTDIKPQYVQSAVVDSATGRFYWAGFTDEGNSGLYVIDPETYMASLVERFPGNQEIIGLYIVENQKDADMPADVLDLSVEFVCDTYNGTVSFTAPDVYSNGSALTGALTAHVAVDGNHYEQSVMPGQSVTFDVSVNYGGLYNTAAWVSAGSVSGNKKYVQQWVGPDNPCGVSNLTAKVVGTKVLLTWDAPTEGRHGGYINPDAITYIIDRDGYDHMYLRDYATCSFEDDLGEGVSADVRYSVLSVNGDLPGYTVYSDWMHVGAQIMEVPVSLSPNGDFDKFIIVDANGDDNTWEPNFGGFASYTAGSDKADDWMLTPEISLEAGTVYQLEYQVSAKMGLMSPEVIEVKLGMGDSADDMTIMIDEQTVRTFGLTKFTTYTASFSVPVSGIYRLGFHAISDTGQQMGLSGIEITKLASSSGPAAATGLRVEAAPMGELKATIKFTLPTKDSDDKELSAISKVELYNDGALVATGTDATPGAEYSLVDNNAKQGTNRYTVVVYGKDGTKGLVANVSGWVGVDIPSLPTDLRINEIDNGVHLSWNMSDIGLNGGYVDLAEVIYLVVDPAFGMEIAMVKGVTEIDLPMEPLASQTTVSLGLTTMNLAGSNPEGVISPSIKIGPAYELPFHEHFARTTDYGWILKGNEGDEVMGWQPDETAVGMDGQAGMSSYYGEEPFDSQALTSGKIYIPAGSDATLRMWLMGRCIYNNGGSFRILVSETYGEGYEPIFERAFNSTTDASWQTVEVSLKAFAGKTVYLALEGLPAADGGVYIAIDDLSIRESVDFDGAVTHIVIDADEVEVSRSSATVQAWVVNEGLKKINAGDYSVDFYAGDRMFASVAGVEMAPSFGYSNYTAQYEPDVDDADPSKIYAVLSYDADLNPTNNKSSELSVYVVRPELPAAEVLTAQTDDHGVVLGWQPVDLSGKPVRTVTDDFESYRTFDINRAGEWTIIDEDQGSGIRVSYYFNGSSGPMGWVVMEPGAVPTIEGGTLASRQPAYSGEKYMVSYCTGDNKDWLITPLLSGNAQEISFMARAESVNQGREMFEVYYSNTGTELRDFISLDGESHRTEPSGWSEYRFAVPEGARYFAVRCVSHNRMAMHIDDFTYESAATPVDADFIGYNIYRDGKLINDVPTTANTYHDSKPAEGENIYYVRAVYDRGEAPASNHVAVSVLGVDLVLSDIDPAVTPVYNLNGIRVDAMTEGNVYVTRGQTFIYRK